jgi:RHS repeat-associated protein
MCRVPNRPIARPTALFLVYVVVASVVLPCLGETAKARASRAARNEAAAARTEVEASTRAEEARVEAAARIVAAARAAEMAEPVALGPTGLPLFSEVPTDREVARVRLFDEPLIPIDRTDDEAAHERDNVALARALCDYTGQSDTENFDALTSYIERNPTSRWRASLLLNLGLRLKKSGYFTRALSAWQLAWNEARTAGDASGRLVGDAAVGELADLTSRLGRVDALEALLAEIGNRPVSGPATERLSWARQGLGMMRGQPGEAFRCGPAALDRLLAFRDSNDAGNPVLTEARSSSEGMSLAELADLAAKVHMNLALAKREPGAEVPLPSIIHYKSGHFAALVGIDSTGERLRYRTLDLTFDGELWVSSKAVDDEASGYFLVPHGPMPVGWRSATRDECATVRGRGFVSGYDNGATGCDEEMSRGVNGCDGCAGGGGAGSPGSGGAGGAGGGGAGSTGGCASCGSSSRRGMPQYDFHAMLCSLNITDTPLGYTPPRGPAVNLTVRYNQREAYQPASPTHSWLGPKWNFDWISYIEEDSNTVAANVRLYLRGGGLRTFTGYNQSTGKFVQDARSGALLTRPQPTTLGLYELRYPDGSVSRFASPQSTTWPRKVFLTNIKDPAGNQLTIGYVTNQTGRIDYIEDAIGQRTTFTYQSPSSYLVTRVTDPFGRYADFAYTSFPNSVYRLTGISDAIAMTSNFAYTSATYPDFITSMQTPYGTTTFTTKELNLGANGWNRWVEATDPLGGKERVEFRQDPPGFAITKPCCSTVWLQESAPPAMGMSNQYLHMRNTFYWTTKMYAGAILNTPYDADHFLDYKKSKITHWLHGGGGVFGNASGVKESEKMPLENRVWYRYPGQPTYYEVGTLARPTHVGQYLKINPNTTAWQYYQFQYNTTGNATQVIDPLNRVTNFLYSADGIDLLDVRQVVSGGDNLIVHSTYNGQHLPLTDSGPSLQTTQITYNAWGQVRTIQNAKGETTTYDYDGNGYLVTTTGPVAGAVKQYTYDGYGRPHSITDSDGATLTYTYDALDRVRTITYPDSTYAEFVYDKLDVQSFRDRLGRTTTMVHDALGHTTSITDPEQRITTFDWCACGALEAFTDANQHTTTFVRDIQGRVTRKLFHAGGQPYDFFYYTGTNLLQSVREYATTTQYWYNIDGTVDYVDNLNLGTPGYQPFVNIDYDTYYPRPTQITDATGITGITYKPVTVGTGTLGALSLDTVDGPLASDLIAYTYDELGRVTQRTVNGVGESVHFDALSRVDQITNSLGTFTRAFNGVTSRLQTETYPNGQHTDFTYYPTSGDHRLQQLRQVLSGGGTLASFDYVYAATGRIDSIAENGFAQPTTYTYDDTNWLESVTLPGASMRMSSYDAAGNRIRQNIGTRDVKFVYNAINQLMAAAGIDEPTIPATDTAGVYDPANGNIFLRNTNTAGVAEISFTFGAGGSNTKPLKGDWDGDGTDTIGLYDANNGAYYLKNTNTSGIADTTLFFGGGGGIPVAGDWNGDGVDTIGFYVASSSTFFLRNSNTSGIADATVSFGPAGSGWKPIVGDWDNNGTDTIGLFNPVDASFYLRNDNSPGAANYTFYFGSAGQTPIVGDWNADGTDTVGTSSGDAWFLRNSHSAGPADITFNYGGTGKLPLPGDWERTYTYDHRGNLLSDGTRTFEWDGLSRLVAVNQGNLRSEFTYDSRSRNTRIVEKLNGNVTSDKRHIWDGTRIVEERDGATNQVTRRFFEQGFTVDGTPYFYTRDHLGSVRYVTNTSGTVVASYSYDSWGNATPGSNTVESPVGYAGYRRHSPSGLLLTQYRAYDPTLARWISRDPIGEAGGINVYAYVGNSPVALRDPLGLHFMIAQPTPSGDGAESVILCGQLGDDPWLQSLNAYHWWLKVGVHEVGMGPAREGGFAYEGTMVTDHWGRSRQPGVVMIRVPDADPEIVKRHMAIGTPLGNWWWPGNTCQTWAQDVLFKAARGPCPQIPRIPLLGPDAHPDPPPIGPTP